jgi:hypothetical protein
MTDHAITNARAWLETITAGFVALEALEMDGAESVQFEGQTFSEADELHQVLVESALSVQLRDGWRSPGSKGEAEEYEILLSTGGPALRIWGRLDGFEPDEWPELQHQDWGTPWTALPLDESERADIARFARMFCFYEA